VKLFWYAIIIGDLRNSTTNASTQAHEEDKRKLKKETKRALIQRLLEENPPDSKHFSTDYDSVINSVGPLFNGSAETLNQVTDTEHWLSSHRARPNNRIIKSQVKYLGNVNTTGLLAHVTAGAELKELVNELKALNVITWKNIIKPGFQGGRAGNKFYPVAAKEPRAELASSNKSLYFIRNGFFSSMRPGDDSLLLNVNSVTSAFFTPMKLQTWIEICWLKASMIRNRDFKPKLKDVRVTLDLHTGGEAWVICGINSTRVSGTTFTKDDGTVISVANYLRTGLFFCSYEKCDILTNATFRCKVSKSSVAAEGLGRFLHQCWQGASTNMVPGNQTDYH